MTVRLALLHHFLSKATTARKMVGTATMNTTTALKRWSCVEKALPSPSETKYLHIYDFDNTCRFFLGIRRSLL